MSASVVVPAAPRPEGSPLQGVKHVIAVASGKGGVGKSTTAVNLAAALHKLGARVGLLDADIYGPSLPRLLNVNEEPMRPNEKAKVQPVVAYGMKMMSMGLLRQGGPVLWRGPIASRALTQFLSDVEWGDLDYLIVDLPPGTGDIHITLSQAIKISGSVIVMTPQKLAVEIATHALQMFQQMRVPVLGMVENMSGFECPQCQTLTPIFKKGGGAEAAKQLNMPLLASLPLDPILVEESDEGRPAVLTRPDSNSAKLYLELAQRMASELSAMLSGARHDKPIVIKLEPNEAARMLKVSWSDGPQNLIAFRELRYLCPCAHCVNEVTGQRIIKKENVAEDVAPRRINTVGNYAVQIHWSDGHDSGLYSYDYLRRLLVKSPA